MTFGRRAWTVEKRFNDFCALDALLRQHLTPPQVAVTRTRTRAAAARQSRPDLQLHALRADAPSAAAALCCAAQAAALAPLPRRVPDFAIDNAVRCTRLDLYCKTLCAQVGEDVRAAAKGDQHPGTGAEDANFLPTQFVRLVYDFVNFREHCWHGKGPTGGVQDAVTCATTLEWKALPEHSKLVASADGRGVEDEREYALLMATEAELSKLIEELSDADQRSQAHADTKKSLGQQVVAAQAEIPPLLARVQVGALQLEEAKDGPGAAREHTFQLCSLARQLDAAAQTLVEAVRRWQTASAAPRAQSPRAAAAQVHPADTHDAGAHENEAVRTRDTGGTFSNGTPAAGQGIRGRDGDGVAGRGGAGRDGSAGAAEEEGGASAQRGTRDGLEADAQTLTAAVAGAIQRFLDVEEACARIAAGPASVLPGGGVARGRMLLTVQTAQMLAENAALWRGLAESAETQRRVGAYLVRQAPRETPTAEHGDAKSGGSSGGSPLSSGEMAGGGEGGSAVSTDRGNAAQKLLAKKGGGGRVSSSPSTAAGSMSDKSSGQSKQSSGHSKQSSDDGTMSRKYRRQKIQELSDILSAAYRTPSATSNASSERLPTRISSGGMHAGPKDSAVLQHSAAAPSAPEFKETRQEDAADSAAEAAAATSLKSSEPTAAAAIENTGEGADVSEDAQSGVVGEGQKEDGEEQPGQMEPGTQARTQAEARQTSPIASSVHGRNLDGEGGGLDPSRAAAPAGGGGGGLGHMACAHCGTLGENLKRCGKCKSAWYCDKSCQAAAWLAGALCLCVRVCVCACACACVCACACACVVAMRACVRELCVCMCTHDTHTPPLFFHWLVSVLTCLSRRNQGARARNNTSAVR